MDRMPGLQPGGWGFDSLRAHMNCIWKMEKGKGCLYLVNAKTGVTHQINSVKDFDNLLVKYSSITEETLKKQRKRLSS